jgi:hypothetical protein
MLTHSCDDHEILNVPVEIGRTDPHVVAENDEGTRVHFAQATQKARWIGEVWQNAHAYQNIEGHLWQYEITVEIRDPRIFVVLAPVDWTIGDRIRQEATQSLGAGAQIANLVRWADEVGGNLGTIKPSDAWWLFVTQLHAVSSYTSASSTG